jgi:gliding motility-associated-like protein
MDINNKYSGFEKLLQNKVSNFEYPYNNKDWQDFEKKLPKSPKSFTSAKNLFRLFILAAAIIGSVVTIIYFTDNSTTNSNSDKVSSNKNNINVTNDKIQNSVNRNNKSNNVSIDKDNSGKTSKTNNKFSSDNASNESSTNDNQNTSLTKSIDNKSDNSNTDVKKDITTNSDKKPQNFGDAIIADITDGCAPMKVQFKPAKSTDNTVSLMWNFGDGKISSKVNPSHVYSKAGSYEVSLTVTFLETKTSTKFVYSNKITVKGKPAANYDYAFDDETEIYTFSDNSTNALNYYWNFGDKTSSAVKNPEHEFKKNGTYNVQLIVMNTYGCTDTLSKNVTVKLMDLYKIPTGFTPNGDGLNDYFGPQGDRMNSDNYKMTIFDKNGLKLFETTDLNTQWDGKIAGSNADAAQGIYFWKISMKDKNGVLKDGTGYVTLLRQ